MKKASIILIGIFLVVAIFIFMQPSDPPETGKIKTLRYSFILTNTTNHTASNVEFFTHAPVKKTPFQQCTEIETFPPCQVLSDVYDNQVLHFQFDRFPPYGNKIIAIKAIVETFDNSRRDKPSDLGKWLMPEKWIESDDPLIIAKTKVLKKSDNKITANALFNFVADHISYSGYLRNERGARYALLHRKGDCTEYTDLFTALCRAGGIPAQRVGGYICHQAAGKLNGSGYHNWSHALIKNEWYVVDPQNRVFNERQSDYIAMKIIGTHEDRSIPVFNRFKIKGDGIAVKMES